MSRRVALLVLAIGFASGTVILSSVLARAAEPAQRVVRVGFVSPQSPATATPGMNAFAMIAILAGSVIVSSGSP